MTTIEQPTAPVTPPTWLDSLARIVTVWGLGLGTAAGASLIAASVYYCGGGSFLLSMILAFTLGATGAGCVLYLDYIKGHVRVDPAWKYRSAKVVSTITTLAYLFVVASLFSLFMIPIIVVGVLYVRAKAQRGQSWRRRVEMFIGEAMPRIAFL